MISPGYMHNTQTPPAERQPRLLARAPPPLLFLPRLLLAGLPVLADRLRSQPTSLRPQSFPAGQAGLQKRSPGLLLQSPKPQERPPWLAGAPARQPLHGTPRSSTVPLLEHGRRTRGKCNEDPSNGKIANRTTTYKNHKRKRSKLRPMLTALSVLRVHQRSKVEWTTRTCENPLWHASIFHGGHVASIIEKEERNVMSCR